MAVQKKQRDEKGLFAEGNTIGKAYEFSKGNSASDKYRTEYCDDLVQFFEEHEGFPTLEAFAAYKARVSINTLTNWCYAHPEFARAVEIAKTIQLSKIHEGTMLKRYDASYARFLAINNHGMTDKSQVDIGNKDDEGFKVTVTVDD